MRQSQHFCHALPYGQNSFLSAPDMNKARLCDEYIVERVLDRRSETVCWEGSLRILQIFACRYPCARLTLPVYSR